MFRAYRTISHTSVNLSYNGSFLLDFRIIDFNRLQISIISEINNMKDCIGYQAISNQKDLFKM